MNDRANLQTADAPLGSAIGQVLDKAKSAWTWTADMLTAYAEAWGAALLYEELSKLSDADLERRGLRRAELHRHIFGDRSQK
jgi:hypothetical protein